MPGCVQTGKSLNLLSMVKTILFSLMAKSIIVWSSFPATSGTSLAYKDFIADIFWIA